MRQTPPQRTPSALYLDADRALTPTGGETHAHAHAHALRHIPGCADDSAGVEVGSQAHAHGHA
jgi:hypothetical protein